MKNRNPIHLESYNLRSCLFRTVIVLVLLAGSLCSFSQTPISGVVNTYYSVVEILPAKACLRLHNTSGLNYNDKVMIVQMKGASINTSNSGSFGDTTSLNNAGNYEIATVCHVDGDSLFLVYMMLNNYTVSGKVQVVKIPQYNSAIVTDTLKAAAWNNTTGRGGVIAISVENDLTLNAPIYADSSGFRGGAYLLSGNNCNNFFPTTDYYYDGNNGLPGTQDGAFKGEAIVDLLASQSGGRGAPANGGGGGNNHNNGGGGGANLAIGGIGGGNSSSVGCRVSIQGLGGKALSNHGGRKIFFGGGGGAGHSNYNLPNARGGGNGGGIVFIEANTIIGNNRKISSNGNSGGGSLGDGASGGGAGGTIIMEVNSVTGFLIVEANGGQGGTANDGGNVGRCYGGGGGGGGGAVYFAGAIPVATITATAGAAGPEVGREASCNPIIPAGAGGTGQISGSYSIASSAVITSEYCGLLLPVDLVWFKANYTGEKVMLNWKMGAIGQGEIFEVERSTDQQHWTTVRTLGATGNKTIYHTEDNFPADGINFYRLKIVGHDNDINYSSIQQVIVPVLKNRIAIYPNPARDNIRVTGIPAFAEIVLVDMSGQTLRKIKSIPAQNEMNMDVRGLKPGIYLLRIGEIVKKLVIK